MSKNPKLRKNGGPGSWFGNLLRAGASIGKAFSPKLMGIIDVVSGKEKGPDANDFLQIQAQLAEDGFDKNDLEFLKGELEKDKQEMIEITKRWESDNKSEHWLPRIARPVVLWTWNFMCISMIFLDSMDGLNFNVDPSWNPVILSNLGIVNTAYFGSRYLEKRDKRKS